VLVANLTLPVIDGVSVLRLGNGLGLQPRKLDATPVNANRGMILLLFSILSIDLVVLGGIIINMKTEKKKDSPKPTATTSIVGCDLTPLDIAMLAEREDDRKPAETHIRAIQVLRDTKNFSFREIADWLKDFDVKVDANAVYRAYMSTAFERCSSQEEIDKIEREADAEMKAEKK
jgi:hypothetical protein